jgi:photosystem II stability/assembly factor-like uncharacterized protein
MSRMQPSHMAHFIAVFLVLVWGHLAPGPSAAQTYDWLMAEGPEGGEITTLAEAPNGYLFAGLWSGGGVFRSTDQGLTWQESGLLLDQVSEIIINNAGTIFAALSNGEIHRSLDNGASWWVSATGRVDHLGAMAYDPDLNILFAARREYFSSSTDDGDSWQLVSDEFPFSQVRSLAAVPGGGPLFVGTIADKVFRSDNDGVTWTLFDSGMTTNGIYDFLVVPEGDIYAASYGGGIYRTAWDGTTWTQLKNGLDDDFCMTISRDPAGSLWTGTVASGPYVSHDSGLNWAPSRVGIEMREVRDFLFLEGGKFLAACHGGGVFRTDDSGATWTPSSGELSRTIITSLLHSGAGTMFATTYGAGVHRSTDGGVTWSHVNDGIADPIVFDIVSHPDGDLFCGTWDTHIYHSSNGGDSWLPTGATPNILRVGSLAVRPDSGDLFVGGMFEGGVWRSPDKGDSWVSANGNLPLLGVEDIVVEDDGDLLVSIEGGGVFRSEDDGGFWTPLNNGLTSLSVDQLLSLPGGVLFAAITYHGLFRSLDDGANWERVDSSLNESRITSVVVNPNGFLFAGALAGGRAFQSTDVGDSWFPITSLPSYVPIHALAFNANGNLVAGTYAFGVFYTDESTPVFLQDLTAARSASGSVTVSWYLPTDVPHLTGEVFRSVAGSAREQLSSIVLTGGPEFEFIDISPPADPCDYWLRLTDAGGPQSWYGPVSVEKADLVVSGLTIESVWPNPALGSATIRFSVPRDETARLDVFDLRGRLVRQLWQSAGGQGSLEAVWDARDDRGSQVASGTYFLRLWTETRVVTGKVVVLGNQR